MSVDVEAAVPPAPMSPRFRRALAILVGVAALSAAVISWVEANSGRLEEKAFVDASRGSLAIFVRIAGGSPRRTFEADSTIQALLVSSESLGRILGSPKGRAFELASKRGPAEQAASRRLLLVARTMAEVPEEVPKLDSATITVLRSDTKDLKPLLREQNAAVERANKYGTRQERGMFALGLVAIAASLLGLAGLMGDGRGGRISLITAASALGVALLATASGFVF